MADTTKSFQEALDDLGIDGSYIWQPNRFFAKKGSRYYSADTYSDASAAEITEAVSEAGAEAMDEIEELGNARLNYLNAYEKNFRLIQENVLQTYRRLYLYFNKYNISDLAEITAEAISEIEGL